MPRDEPGASTLVDPAHTSRTRLGQRLRSIRLQRHLTQGDVAKNLFSISYISGVERGLIRPSLGSLERLAERLEVPITDLVADEGEADEGDVAIRPTSSAVDSRERTAERLQEEVESAIREIGMLIYQQRSGEGIAVLLHLRTQHLAPREAAIVHLSLSR
jgi:transcriptional regulator with XRE-family HTH domain